jgi:DnaJ-class molecular chaperone
MGKISLPERKCAACDGSGFSKIKQATKPGRRIYPARCTECRGKGRIQGPNTETDDSLGIQAARKDRI